MAGPRYGDFKFPSKFGFTGSATDRKTVPVKPHERLKPQKRAVPVGKAMGGPVGYSDGGKAATVVSKAIRRHVATPKPAGHGVRKPR